MNNTIQKLKELINTKKKLENILKEKEYIGAGLKVKLSVGENGEEIEIYVIEVENLDNILNSIYNDVKTAITFYSVAAREEIEELENILIDVQNTLN